MEATTRLVESLVETKEAEGLPLRHEVPQHLVPLRDSKNRGNLVNTQAFLTQVKFRYRRSIQNPSHLAAPIQTQPLLLPLAVTYRFYDAVNHVSDPFQNAISSLEF